MPFYEYECPACRERFVRQQRMSDPPVAVCPNCREPVRKVFNAPGIAVRGAARGNECPNVPVCAPGGG